MLSYVKSLRPVERTTPWLVIADPHFEGFAASLIANDRSDRKAFETCDVSWSEFPDGTPNIFIDVSKVKGRDVLLVVSLQPKRLLSTLSVIYAIPRYLARTLTVVAPYLPTGTMERVDREGEVATAKTLARMLSATPSPQIGEAAFCIYDIHATVERFYFTDRVKVVLLSAIPLLKSYLRRVLSASDLDQLIIAFPDEGARKRFGPAFKAPAARGGAPAEFKDILTCAKVRDGDARRVTISDGPNPKGRRVIIIDDLVQSGGTLLECCEVLRRAGASSVWGYVTHPVFPRDGHVKFVEQGRANPLRAFDKFITTDSVPEVASVVRKFGAPFEILSLAEDFVRVPKTVDHSTPVAKL